MADGWSELGAVLGGGLQDGSAAFADQMHRHGQAAGSMWKARQERAQAIAREGLGEATRGVFTDPAQAAYAAAVLGSAETPNSRNLGAFENPAARALFAERQSAFESGDFKRMNAATAVLGDKQYEPLTLGAGGKAVFDPVTGDTTLTTLGEGALGAEHALAGQRDASGQASLIRANAAAARAGRPSASTPGRYTAPAQGNMDAVLGDDNTGAARDFALWRQAHPEIRNGAQALDAYNAELGRGGAFHLIEADRPGSMTLAPPAPSSVPVTTSDDVLGDTAPARTTASRAWAPEEVMQAIQDARAAIATGRISREEAQKRLLQAGLGNAAERL